MAPSDLDDSDKQPLMNVVDNQNNRGIIGDGSNNFVNSGTIIIEINDSEDELDRSIAVYVSKDALHNSFYSPPECHPNTRTTIRNEIGEWIDDSASDKSPLLWLNGPAGVGKSSIAKTIALSHEQLVVATFFFSTSSDRTAATLFPTLAWQLARKIPETRKHIITSLKSSVSLQTTQIEEQFDLLIRQPLKKSTMGSKPRPVMIIDGADECTDEIMLLRFLRVLVRASEDGDMPVRFIICSRPESRIHAILGIAHVVDKPKGKAVKIPHIALRVLQLLLPLPRENNLKSTVKQKRGLIQDIRGLYRPIRLGVDNAIPSTSDNHYELADKLDIIFPHQVISTIQIGFSDECKKDITRYLTDKLSAIPQPVDDTDPWFQPSDITSIVEASCGQFLYASTIIRLLDEPHFDPKEIFDMARRGFLPTPDLNKLYKSILKRAHDSLQKQARAGGPDDKMELGFLTDSLKILVFFSGDAHFYTVPKSFTVIESLLGLKAGKLTKKLCMMHSVLNVVPGEIVQVHHRSFLEFLQSRERSGEYCIPYSTALRRMLVLLVRVGYKTNVFKANKTEKFHIQAMLLSHRSKFFERSRFPYTANFLHGIIHVLLMMPLVIFLFPLMFFSVVLFVNLKPIAFFATWTCVIMVLVFFCFVGSFILTTITYVWFYNRSIIVPLFHPFLHPFFAYTGGFLLPSRIFYILLFIFLIVLLVFLITVISISSRN